MVSLPKNRKSSQKRNTRRVNRRRQIEQLERRDLFSGVPGLISIHAAGGFNGDGYEDVVSQGSREEMVEVRFGAPRGLTETETWPQDSPGILGRREVGNGFGESLGVGDFNGDRYELTQEDNGAVINVETGGSITIRLWGNPSTGYSWNLVDQAGEAMELDGVEFQPDPHAPGMVGYGGTYVYRFKAVEAGTTNLRLVYAQPWDEQSAPVDQFSVSINVTSDSTLPEVVLPVTPWFPGSPLGRFFHFPDTQDHVSLDGEVDAAIGRLPSVLPTSIAPLFFRQESTNSDSTSGKLTPHAIDGVLSVAQPWWDAAADAVEVLTPVVETHSGSSTDRISASGSIRGDGGSASGSARMDVLGFDGGAHVDGDWTDGNVGCGAAVSAYLINASAEGQFATNAVDVAGVKVSAYGEGSTSYIVGVHANAGATVGIDGLELSTTAFVGATITAGGTVGANIGGIKAELEGEAVIHVGAAADATLATTDEGLEFEATAFAGDRFVAAGSSEVGGIGVEGRAEAWAGVGCTAEADFTFEDGKLTIELGLGAALGIGGKLSLGCTIDVHEIRDNMVHAAEDVGAFVINATEEVSDFVTDAGNHVSKALNTVHHEAEKVVNKVGSFFKKLF